MIESGVLTETSAKAFAAAHVRTPEELYAAMQTYPSLATRESFALDLPQASNALAQKFGAEMSFVAKAKATAKEKGLTASRGAIHPEGAPAPLKFSVEAPDMELSIEQIAGDAEPAEDGDAIETWCPLADWPIRDQGYRGTCVAFATVACREQMECGGLDLSEQYLYWAVKDVIGDPWPNDDGTLIEYAVSALQSEGVCDEALWPYNPTPIPGNISQGTPAEPSAAARADAQNYAHSASRYKQGTGSGNAQRLKDWLSGGRAVAIALPVFVDPSAGSDNWTSGLGWAYGKVLDPAPTSVVDGGHAVCAVGWLPDPGEPEGGHFIIRNSWSTGWGDQLPAPGYAAPAPGYGQVSASYVERFLWEMAQM